MALLLYNRDMNLKELRISKGLTQLEVSEYLSIPIRTYKRIESDDKYLNSNKYKYVYDSLLKYSNTQKNELPTRKIAIIGAGYVGYSLAVLFSIHHQVTLIDIDPNKVDRINKHLPLFKDDELENYLSTKKLNLKGSVIDKSVYRDSDIHIVCVPTNYDENTHSFNMSVVLNTIKDIRSVNKHSLIVIKSTSYIGFTESLKDNNIIFSPEFLREGKALRDNLCPSRIIIGGDKKNKKVKEFGDLLYSLSINNPSIIYMSSSEAEAVKLFSNAYLAMRVSYFNELDSLMNKMDLNSKNVILGVSLDERIGDYYNNPSFGYGGYCLPKDTEMLISQMNEVSNHNLLTSIKDSNDSRKEYIVNDIISKVDRNEQIGVFSLESKYQSDNNRKSAIIDIINLLIDKGYNIHIYDKDKESLDTFKKESKLILTNRYQKELDDVIDKIYTRDIFVRD